MFFLGINMLVVYKGIDCIRWLLNIKAPMLIALGLMLLWWAYRNAGGFGPILAQPSAFAPVNRKQDNSCLLRARAHRNDRILGDALAQHSGFLALRLLATRSNRRTSTRSAADDGALFVHRRRGHSATTIIYGQTIWDPVDVLTHFTNPVILVVAMLALCIATLAPTSLRTSSARERFSHVAPHKISFRMGGLITGIVGIVMMPWKLVADPSGYIFTWLVGYSALLGPIGGIMIADFMCCVTGNFISPDSIELTANIVTRTASV